MDDAGLVRMLRKGDDAAFTEIYGRYWDKLFSVAANKLNKDLALAEELVQDIFLDLWHRRKDLDQNLNLPAYLATAMKYKVINARQKKKRVNAYLQKNAARLSTGDSSTEQQLSFNELKDRLAALVKNLPDKCRLVYTLSKDAGYSQKEISKQLSISEKTVESHLSRAIKSLRSGLQIFFSHIL